MVVPVGRVSRCFSIALAAQTLSFDEELRQGLIALKTNPALAKQKLERAAKMQPRNPKVWVALAQAYLGAKQPDLANQAAKKAETLSAADPVVQHALAMFFPKPETYGAPPVWSVSTL